RLDRVVVAGVLGVRDVRGRLRLEAREPGVRDDQAPDRLAGARVAVVRDGDLEVAAEADRVEVPVAAPARLANELDAVAKALDVGADGEADSLRGPDRRLDRPRAGGRDVDGRLRDADRRVDVVQPRHRRDDAVDLDVLAPQERLQSLEVRLEPGDGHRL